jgi:hypothetical protein
MLSILFYSSRNSWILLYWYTNRNENTQNELSFLCLIFSRHWLHHPFLSFFLISLSLSLLQSKTSMTVFLFFFSLPPSHLLLHTHTPIQFHPLIFFIFFSLSPCLSLSIDPFFYDYIQAFHQTTSFLHLFSLSLSLSLSLKILENNSCFIAK